MNVAKFSDQIEALRERVLALQELIKPDPAAQDPAAVEELHTALEALRVAEEQIHTLNAALERRVFERTTELKAANQAQEALLVAEQAARAEAEAAQQRYRSLFEHNPDAVVELDLEGRFLNANPAAEQISGYQVEELLGKPFAPLVIPKDRERALEHFFQVTQGNPQRIELAITHKDGHRVELQVTAVPIVVDGQVTGVYVIAKDITARKRVEEELKVRARQQEAVVHFGQRALAGTDLCTLVNEAVALVPKALAVDRSGFWEVQPDGRTLLLRAGAGWPEGSAGALILDTTSDSQAGYTLLSGEPVVVADWRRETRFKRPGPQDHGVVSSLSVIIRGRERPFGLLDAHTTQPRAFSEDDVHFLQAMANVLAATIEREQAEETLREREEQLRFTLEAVKVGTWEWDIQTGKVHWSDNLEPIHGLAPGTFGRTLEAFLELVYPQDRDFVTESVRQAVEARAPYDLEFRTVWPDGSVHWIAGKGRVFYDETGRPVRMVGVGMDMTARKRVEQTLRFLAEAASLLAASPDYETRLASVARLAASTVADYCLIDVLDEDGQIRRIAGAHADPEKDEMIREAQRFPPDLQAPGGVGRVLRTGEPLFVPEITSAQLETGARDAGHLKLLRQLGPESAIIVPLRARGRTLGAISLVSAGSGWRYTSDDLAMAETLAHRVTLAIDNARLYREAQEAISARDAFLSIASHEIKTPLATIKGYAQLLQRRATHQHTIDERDQRALESIYEQTVRLDKLIDLLLDFSRLQGGRLKIERRRVDLFALVRRLVEALQPTLERHRVELFAPSEPLLVTGDEVRLEQVLQNLLNNAVKYSPRGGHVTVRLERQGEAACLTVSDQGIGIPAEALPQLFSPFYRAPNVARQPIRGTGLGLFIIKELVTLHGGDVEVVSREGQGSTFTVRLPLRDPAAD